MKTLALYNLKGGVGKTAAAVNLAWLAAEAGRPTLLWDLDAQAAATWYLGLEPGLVRPGKLVKGKRPLGAEVRRTAHDGLDVLPADFALRQVDGMLARATDSRKHLRSLAEPFAETYSLLVLDCPPGLSALSEQVFRAADLVLVPVVPTPLSLRAYEQVAGFFADSGLPRKRLRPFYSMVDRRRRLHRDWLEHPPPALKRLLAAWIPYASDVERMGAERAPVPLIAPRGRASAAYRSLWEDLARRLGLARSGS